MKTLVIYYSYSGHTRTFAKRIAAEEAADLAEIKDSERLGMLKAYSAGCFAAIKGRAWPIAPIDADLSSYDRLIFLSPIWAGNIPPAANAFLALLPKNKAVSVRLISGSGKSTCRNRIESLIQSKGCTVDSFQNIKG